MTSDGRLVAVLVYDRSADDDPELVEAVSGAAAIALENLDLRKEVQARLSELQASRNRVISAADAERRRIERDLHDGAQQRLLTLAVQLSLAGRRVRQDPAEAEHLIAAAGSELTASLHELRELARGIHPASLDQGLDVALETLALRSSVPTTLACEPGPPLPAPVAFAAYCVVSEALTNLTRHAAAGSASITLRRGGGRVTVEITDDGRGGADPGTGTGLRGLRDRLEAVGGQLHVRSPEGAGTVITGVLPNTA